MFEKEILDSNGLRERERGGDSSTNNRGYKPSSEFERKMRETDKEEKREKRK